jgi:hypothetical protein
MKPSKEAIQNSYETLAPIIAEIIARLKREGKWDELVKSKSTNRAS